ncbi:MAG TPA: 1-deoxy-D-xylulose-5-phosphate synthase [bacterium]|nr:1-deoxy-D-xylulose-5-phosphate synthase [bacterium]
MKKLLPEIREPADLKKLSRRDLETLAAEVRERIIRVVSENGGHLAASLGVVELTLALYRVFDLPRDKVIWDVGHQAYAHKLLTGREREFDSIRTLGGISGFPKIKESPYDSFGVGHASTSLSAALGLAAARDQSGGREKIIAVIGDGALTGGLALEALNQGGAAARNTLVVLNANEMAIAPSVGALSEYLNQLITAPTYNRLKHEMEEVMRRIPGVGSRVVNASHRLEEALKGLITPGQIFEEFGYRYVGPVNGHDLTTLVEILEKVRGLSDPVLLHVVTRKGKGYPPAEKNPEWFHGLGAFDIATGRSRKSSDLLSYSDVFGQTLIRLGATEPKLVAVSAAMPLGTGLCDFGRRFPSRFYDVGIAEGHAVTFAAGMAAGGLKPVVALYSTFLQRAYDQVVHDVCLQELPVVFAIDRAGLVGADGPTHHGVFDISYLRHIPGLTIMQPRDGKELCSMLATALALGRPAVVRYPRGASELTAVPERPVPLPDTRAEIVKEGTNGWFWALGGEMIGVALAAAEILGKKGLDFGVVNPRFIKPLDRELLLRQVSAEQRIVTLEEHVLAGGFGAAVMEELEDAGRSTDSVIRIGIADRFIEHGPVPLLRELCGLTPEAVAEKVSARLP